MSTGATLFGHLRLRPGAAPGIVCERPMVGAPLMQRLAEGRRACLLPDLLATVFTLGAHAQRTTARRAVRTALGGRDEATAGERDARALALYTAREHLQRLALDIPTHAPQPGVAADTGWLRDAPVLALPTQGAVPGDHVLDDMRAALAGWLERRLLGMPAAAWLEGWQADPAAWLQRWSEGHDHPVTRWLAAAREAATGIELPCRPLDVLGAVPQGLHELASALRDERDFAVTPLWRGAPAETGPWTRAARPAAMLPPATPWDRFGARIADLVQTALGRLPALGSLAVAEGEGLAWSEMSRGLLVHWIRLEPGNRQPDTARAASYRVLAPTEWNFHPEGALGRALREGRLDAAGARLAAVSLDPCIAFDVEAAHA